MFLFFNILYLFLYRTHVNICKYRKYSHEECLSYLEGYFSSSLNQGQFEKKWPHTEFHSALASYLWP